MAFDYHSFANAIIDNGQDEVRRTYLRPDQRTKREGALDGFESCRGKQPDELKLLLEERQEATREARNHPLPSRYWYCRFYELQVEWVCNVLSYGMMANGQTPIITPTARSAMKAADILGVKNDL